MKKVLLTTIGCLLPISLFAHSDAIQPPIPYVQEIAEQSFIEKTSNNIKLYSTKASNTVKGYTTKVSTKLKSYDYNKVNPLKDYKIHKTQELNVFVGDTHIQLEHLASLNKTELKEKIVPNDFDIITSLTHDADIDTTILETRIRKNELLFNFGKWGYLRPSLGASASYFSIDNRQDFASLSIGGEFTYYPPAQFKDYTLETSSYYAPKFITANGGDYATVGAKIKYKDFISVGYRYYSIEDKDGYANGEDMFSIGIHNKF